MFKQLIESNRLHELKQLSLKIDLYQMQIIGMKYPDGDKELENEIKQKLIAKMKEAMLKYKSIADLL